MLHEKFLDSLLENKLFENVDREQLEKLDENIFQEKIFEANQLLMEQDSESTEIFLITSGEVKIVKNSNAFDQEIELFRRDTGDFIGEFSLIEGKPRSASVYAVQKTAVLEINKENFFKLLQIIPKIEFNIAKSITSKMRESDDKTTSEMERNIKLIQLNQKIEDQKVELEKANATKDKFFSIIAHDLKNPLTVMIGFSDMLKHYYSQLSEEEVHKIINTINDSSKKLFNLLENLLEWSRAQTGRLNYEPTLVDLSLIASENVSLLLESAITKNIKLISRVKIGSVAFFDENMITTVLRNLTSNAIKFTEQGGEVGIDAEDTGDFYEVSVSDSGIGISPENQEKLFRIDVHHSTLGTSKEQGTGLGLILCKEFVEKNGGKIWVESEVDRGTIFRFTLPKEIGE